VVSKLKGIFSKFNVILALSGINVTAFNNNNKKQPMAMPFESPLLRKLAFTKLVDATAKRVSMASVIQRELIQKIRKCLRSSYYYNIFSITSEF
jgi:hypothetical protein